MVAHPTPWNECRRINDKEYVNLANDLYSIARDVVDPVFFAVVPDSFMTRSSLGSQPFRASTDSFGWAEEQDMPIVMPHDRWSF